MARYKNSKAGAGSLSQSLFIPLNGAHPPSCSFEDGRDSEIAPTGWDLLSHSLSIRLICSAV